MKDAIHHLKHTQKKVIQSVRKAEQMESNSAINEHEQKNKNAAFKSTS